MCVCAYSNSYESSSRFLLIPSLRRLHFVSTKRTISENVSVSFSATKKSDGGAAILDYVSIMACLSEGVDLRMKSGPKNVDRKKTTEENKGGGRGRRNKFHADVEFLRGRATLRLGRRNFGTISGTRPRRRNATNPRDERAAIRARDWFYWIPYFYLVSSSLTWIYRVLPSFHGFY